MDAEIIIEIIFAWKYIWWLILFSWIVISETNYFFMCKFNLGQYSEGDEFGWFEKKAVSFFFGFMAIMIIIMAGTLGMALTSSIINNPMATLKFVGITLAIVGGIFLFFYMNYKIWEKYN